MPIGIPATGVPMGMPPDVPPGTPPADCAGCENAAMVGGAALAISASTCSMQSH
jgi:hypothetical protein